MFFSAYSIKNDDLTLFENYLGSKIPNSKVIYICHKLLNGAPINFTVLNLSNTTP